MMMTHPDLLESPETDLSGCRPQRPGESDELCQHGLQKGLRVVTGTFRTSHDGGSHPGKICRLERWPGKSRTVCPAASLLSPLGHNGEVHALRLRIEILSGSP